MGIRNRLDYRPFVGQTSHLMELIGSARCWHFDAWLAMDRGTFYFIVETRHGGREPLTRHTYKVAGELIFLVPDAPAGAVLVTLSDRALAGLYERLNRIHWRFIVPLSHRKPDRYAGRSIAMHYVRAPSLDPLEGIVNRFAYGQRILAVPNN